MTWVFQAQGRRSLLLLALALGGCGDVLLALNFFIAGLSAFLLGHCVYMALWLQTASTMRWIATLPIVLLLVAAMCWLIPETGDMQWIVSAYLLVIALMATLAARSRLINRLGLLGVYSFLVSDFLLAWNMYRAPIEYSVILVMSTYYLAQGLITLSVLSTSQKQTNHPIPP